MWRAGKQEKRHVIPIVGWHVSAVVLKAFGARGVGGAREADILAVKSGASDHPICSTWDAPSAMV